MAPRKRTKARAVAQGHVPEVEQAAEIAEDAEARLVAAGQVPEVEQVAEIADDEEAQKAAAIERKWETLKKSAYWCGLCCDILRSFQSHISRRPNCKANLNSRPLTEDELKTLRAEFDVEQEDPKRTLYLLKKHTALEGFF